jgi:23S rRNA (adenine-N6)-dimethyltransferase
MKPTTRFSQNFLYSSNFVKSLIEKTGIDLQDVVYDIGAGKGIITDVLAQKAHTVIAIEIDPRLVAKLRRTFQHRPNIIVHEANVLNFIFPQTPYKVFASIPYNLSADILHRLLDSNNPPTECYLIVQKEFAKKLISKEGGYNSQLAIVLGVRFHITILEKIHPSNFYPRPRVESVLLAISERSRPLVESSDLTLFRNFIMFAYNNFRLTVAKTLYPIFNNVEFTEIANKLDFQPNVTPSQLHLNQWVYLFTIALNERKKLEKITNNYEAILSNKHSKRTKMNRISKKLK